MNYKFLVMARVFLLLLIVGLTNAGGAYSQKKEIRAVPSFTGINASSVFDITVIKGDTESLTIETADNVMQYVRSEVRNGVLYLYLDNTNRLRNIRALKATVVMKNLERVELSGASKFTAKDLFTPQTFKVSCSGVANVEVNVNTGQLNVETSGASDIRIKANVTGDTDIKASGTSKIRAELRANTVKNSSSGASSLELTGSAADFKMNISGTSRIKAENFAVKTSTIGSSGASKVTLNVSDNLEVNASGTSSIEYKGSPTIEVKVSRTAKVKKI
jgi:hypothetical protein